jgi:hypothetical protein
MVDDVIPAPVDLARIGMEPAGRPRQFGQQIVEFDGVALAGDHRQGEAGGFAGHGEIWSFVIIDK